MSAKRQRQAKGKAEWVARFPARRSGAGTVEELATSPPGGGTAGKARGHSGKILAGGPRFMGNNLSLHFPADHPVQARIVTGE